MVFFVFVFSSVTDILLMGVTEIHTVTVHDSTPLHKIFEGMLFFSRQVKLEFHPKCTMGHRALTQVLSDDVILRKPPLGQQEGK